MNRMRPWLRWVTSWWGHAAAALLHHYALRDNTLVQMLPRWRFDITPTIDLRRPSQRKGRSGKPTATVPTLPEASEQATAPTPPLVSAPVRPHPVLHALWARQRELHHTAGAA